MDFEDEGNDQIEIALIDDTLDIELLRRKLNPRLFDQAIVTNTHVLRVNHDRTPDYMIRLAEEKDIRLPNYGAIICDFKLIDEDGHETSGLEVLKKIAAAIDPKRTKLFLSSKSGFREDLSAELAEIGAEYIHGYEMLFIAAAIEGNQALMELNSQIAKTDRLRLFFNQSYGTNYALGKYRSPDVSAAERGQIKAVEVARRIKQNSITHAEAFDLLDETSVRDAFVSRLDVPSSTDRVEALAGIRGNSVVGRLAFSEDDVIKIKAVNPTDKIVLVIGQDYAPSHNNLIGKVDGVVLLARGTQHVGIIAQNRNIPVLFANKDGHSQFELIGGDKLVLIRDDKESDFANVGDFVSLDGQSFYIYNKKLPLIEPSADDKSAVLELARIADDLTRLSWHVEDSPDFNGMAVLANVSNADEIKKARDFYGIRGVGLFRTEHLLLGREQLIGYCLQAKGEAKTQALDEFYELNLAAFKAAYSVDPKFLLRIRLLDIAPGEYLPQDAPELKPVFDGDLRGVQLAKLHPELYEIQLKAIFAAAKETGVKTPEILVPQVKSYNDSNRVHIMAAKAAIDLGYQDQFKFGVMIETLELLLDYDNPENIVEIIDELKLLRLTCDFVNFGTNDLTEKYTGLTRGDISAILRWSDENRFPFSPFDKLAPKLEDALYHTTRVLQSDNSKAEICFCGEQFKDRDAIEFAQRQRAISISIQSSDFAMAQGLIEAGRIAILSSVKERERILKTMRENAEARSRHQRGEFNKDDGISVPLKDLVAHSNIVFIVIEDDSWMMKYFIKDHPNQPIVACHDLNGALIAYDVYKSQGKKVCFVADMNVPTHSYEGYAHPLAETVATSLREGDERKTGIALANIIKKGSLDGVSTKDIILLTAGNPGIYSLSRSVKWFDKTSDYTDSYVENFFEERKAAINSPVSGNTIEIEEGLDIRYPHVIQHSELVVLLVDDEEDHREFLLRELPGHPVIGCDSIDSALLAYDKYRKQGKKICFIADMGIIANERHHHPLTKEVLDRPESHQGIQLAHAIADGMFEGVTKSDILICSAGIPSLHGLSSEVMSLDKGSGGLITSIELYIGMWTELLEMSKLAAPQRVNEEKPLIVFYDDDALWSDLIRERFEEFGYPVMPTSSADEAIQIAGSRQCVLFMDEIIGSDRGSRLLTAARENGVDVPMALLSLSNNVVSNHDRASGYYALHKDGLNRLGVEENNPIAIFLARARQDLGTFRS